MDTTNTVNKIALIGRNVPQMVEETPRTSTIITVMGVDLELRQYESGAIYVGKVGHHTANKVTFKGYDKGDAKWGFYAAKGFLSGLVELYTAPANAYYRRGAHCRMGWSALGDVYQSKLFDEYTSEGYICWNDVEPETRRELAALGLVEKQGEGFFPEAWVGYTATHNRIHSKHAYRIEPWAQMVKRNADKGITQNDPRFEGKAEAWETRWNIHHKHDGLNLALLVLAGQAFVSIIPASMDEKLQARLEAKLADLILSKEQAIDAAKARQEYYGEISKIKAKGFVATMNTEYAEKSPSLSKAVEAGGYEVWVADGEGEMVSEKDLLKKSLRFVYNDGSSASPARIYVSNLATLRGIYVTADDLGCYVAMA